MTDLLAASSQLDLSNRTVKDTVFEMVNIAHELGLSLDFGTNIQIEPRTDVPRLIELINFFGIIDFPDQSWTK